MTTAYSTNLGLALPVQGELSGTWGDTVNNGITDYVDISVAGTLTLNGDGAVTLANTNGDAAGTNIGSTTAQYAILKITGTTTAKVITAPSSSKTYTVINASSYGVTIKASGQTGVTIAAGEKAYVAFNGTDYVTVAGSAVDGVSTISFGSTGLTPSTATSGAVTVSGTLSAANGGTGLTSSGASGNVLTSNGTTWTSAPLPAGGLTYIFTTTPVTATDKQGVLTDTSGGSFTVTLPATPSTGAQVVIADAGASWGTNNLTVGRNGSTIGGLAENLVCDITGASVQFVYDGTTWEVYAQIGGNGGTAVTLNGVQTLTNKTLTAPTINGGTGSLSGITLNDGYTEEIYAVSGTTPALSPSNGTIQTWTLTGNSTPTAGTWDNGQSITLMVDDGTAYTITWTSLSVTWKTDGGSAPTLNTTGYTAIVLWKVGGIIYGARVGDA